MIFNEDDKNELVGEIIDIFEDDLHNRRIKERVNSNLAVIPLHKEDEESNGVFYGGETYDNVASKLKTLLCEWGCLDN